VKSSKRQSLVTVAAVANRTFTSLAGGEKTGSTNNWYDGGATVPSVVGAPPEVAELTLTNAFDPDVDAAILQALKSQVNILRTTVTRAYLAGDQTRIASAKPDVWTDCLLTGVTPPEADANSGDVATYELKFKPADLT
jgi:hypothetical protein